MTQLTHLPAPKLEPFRKVVAALANPALRVEARNRLARDLYCNCPLPLVVELHKRLIAGDHSRKARMLYLEAKVHAQTSRQQPNHSRKQICRSWSNSSRFMKVADLPKKPVSNEPRKLNQTTPRDVRVPIGHGVSHFA